MKKVSRTGQWIGSIFMAIGYAVAIVCYVFMWNTGMIPDKYMIIGGAALVVLFVALFGLQITRRKGSMIVSVLLIIMFSSLFGLGIYGIIQMNSAMDQVAGSTYKTDSMVVVVRKDDEAQQLSDAIDYQFGSQTAVDQENTKLMVEEVGRTLRQAPKMTEYETVEELAQALLDGKVGAAIYNEAFNGMLNEVIEDYESQVRILYQYGIKTDLAEGDRTVEEPFSVYISGIDVYGPITTTSRSDVNIIMTVNPKTKQILLSTTPRDYYVEIPGISGGKKDKLTHAGIYGVDRSMATLGELYGIDIDYYARVNFSSLIKIVDILDGVEVNSEYAFKAGGYSFNEGMNYLDGEAALAFSRERHSFAEGDNQRGRNQEAVITAMLKKAMSPAILTNASALITSVGDSVETNMTRREMTQLVRMQLEDPGFWDIESVNAVGTGDRNTCYSSGSQSLYVMQPDMASVSEIAEKMKQVLNGEAAQ